MNDSIKPEFDLNVDLSDDNDLIGTVIAVGMDPDRPGLRYKLKNLNGEWLVSETQLSELTESEKIMTVPVSFKVDMTVYVNIDTGQVDHGRIIMPMQVKVTEDFDPDALDGQRVPTARELQLAQDVIDDGEWTIITDSNNRLEWES